MFDRFKNVAKWTKAQNAMQKELEQIFATMEKGGNKVVVRGDKRIEKLEIAGVENKILKDLVNDAFKEVEKKVEKKLRGQFGDQMKDLGIPGV